jgi:hypothetical protein
MKSNIKLPLLVLLLILLIAALPIISVFMSEAIANALGCKLNEANVYPCVVMGMDIGHVLAIMFVMGWLGLATLPLGALALVGWLIWVAILAFTAYRARQS